MKNDPLIYLAIDNCFASKRWTEPVEWMSVAKDLGINYVEASADNECDPLYSTKEYLNKWSDEIGEISSKTGVKVCNLYSGHGTYATLGLAHTDKSVRKHILNNWLKPMVDKAKTLDAGLGFYCHAFNQNTLQDKNLYEARYNNLVDSLSELSSYVGSVNLKSIGVEQMYSPHQIPWTMTGAREMIKSIYSKSKQPFYITLDVGHQSGQRKFLKPTREMLAEILKEDSGTPEFWIGSDHAYKIIEESHYCSTEEKEKYFSQLLNEIEDNPHFYATFDDGDPYYWIKNLGAYSPIIHLQQTDGTHSSHLPFTEKHNKNGIIKGELVLQNIYECYQNLQVSDLPPACEEIYLTIEVFASTSSIPKQVLKDLEKTAEYWRKFIPEDGLRLSNLIQK